MMLNQIVPSKIPYFHLWNSEMHFTPLQRKYDHGLILILKAWQMFITLIFE